MVNKCLAVLDPITNTLPRLDQTGCSHYATVSNCFPSLIIQSASWKNINKVHLFVGSVLVSWAHCFPSRMIVLKEIVHIHTISISNRSGVDAIVNCPLHRQRSVTDFITQPGEAQLNVFSSLTP